MYVCLCAGATNATVVRGRRAAERPRPSRSRRPAARAAIAAGAVARVRAIIDAFAAPASRHAGSAPAVCSASCTPAPAARRGRADLGLPR